MYKNEKALVSLSEWTYDEEALVLRHEVRPPRHARRPR